MSSFKPMTPRALLLSLALTAAAAAGGCAAAHGELRAPQMEPLPVAEQSQQLEKNHFKRDKIGTISEQALRRVLAAPVFLERDARVGVVQVAERYDPDAELPLADVPAVLTRVLDEAAFFEVATEISTDWPATSGIPGLRELAARYRAEYLLLYRHRFIDRSYLNGWAWLYPTVIGALAAPSRTLEAAGVLEATLFDAKTGTILFTVFERVHDSSDESPFYLQRKRRALKQRLLEAAAEALAQGVLEKTRLLVAARPERAPETSQQAASPLQPPAQPGLIASP